MYTYLGNRAIPLFRVSRAFDTSPNLASTSPVTVHRAAWVGERRRPIRQNHTKKDKFMVSTNKYIGKRKITEDIPCQVSSLAWARLPSFISRQAHA